jgi:hypothetical protein
MKRRALLTHCQVKQLSESDTTYETHRYKPLTLETAFPFLLQFLVHSVWILHLDLQAKVREQTMPAQARTHLEGQVL